MMERRKNNKIRKTNLRFFQVWTIEACLTFSRLYKIGVRYSITTLTSNIVLYPIVIDTIIRMIIFDRINRGR